MMSRLKHLEDLIGTGPIQLKDGEPVGEAAYELSIYQEVHDAGAEEVDGLRRIEGHVDGLDNFGLMGKELTLQLEDRRFFDFFIANRDGTIGAQSGLYTASER